MIKLYSDDGNFIVIIQYLRINTQNPCLWTFPSVPFFISLIFSLSNSMNIINN